MGGFQKKGLSPEEYQHQRTQLLNRQQLETADLERRLSEEEQDIERGALTDWEVQYARAKLDLKEKHYKVRDNYCQCAYFSGSYTLKGQKYFRKMADIIFKTNDAHRKKVI